MSELPRKVESKVRHEIRQTGPISGIKMLRELTGWGLKEAKDWVDGCGTNYRPPSMPCPYCGRRLRSLQAKQCRRCFRDWHDEANIVFLGTNDPWSKIEQA